MTIHKTDPIIVSFVSTTEAAKELCIFAKGAPCPDFTDKLVIAFDAQLRKGRTIARYTARNAKGGALQAHVINAQLRSSLG